MKADATDFSHLLRGGYQYVIPIFQRTYVWQHKQWVDLWEDLKDLLEENTEPGHFIGSIVCAAVDNQLATIPSYVIVDGQQRFVTLVTLMCALRDITKSRPGTSSIADEIQESYLIHKNKQGYERYKLLPRAGYRESLFGIMEENPRLEQQDSIRIAYDFFKERLSAGEFNDARLKDFFLAVTQRLKLVLITLEKDENPFPIFEALNSTGIDVLQSDMIRNFVFTKMNLEEQNAFDSSEWQPLENLFAKTHNFKEIPLDDFYKDYLMISGDYVRDEEIYVKFRDRMKRRDPSQIVSDIRPIASLYMQLNRPELSSDDHVRAELSRILVLNQTASFPLLLDLFTRNSRGELDNDALLRLLRAIQSFILRRQILGLSTRPYRKWFAEMCGLKTDRLEVKLYERFVIRGWPKDSEFLQAISTFELYNSGIDKMILLALEESFASRAHIDASNIQVDLVMPHNIGDDEEGRLWKSMLGPRWQEIHHTWVHTLGNLTLTHNNPDVGDLSFLGKKAIYSDSKLELNKHFGTVSSWGEDGIKTRATVLAKKVAAFWPTKLN